MVLRIDHIETSLKFASFGCFVRANILGLKVAGLQRAGMIRISNWSAVSLAGMIRVRSAVVPSLIHDIHTWISHQPTKAIPCQEVMNSHVPALRRLT